MTDDHHSFLLLSTRVTEESNYCERRSSLAYDYVSYFETLGFTVIPVPCNTKKTNHYFQIKPHAIVLTGGNTVENTNTNDEPSLPGVYIERDRVETDLLKTAIKFQIPVLGICRGMQMINRYFGGQIRHHIQGHVGSEHPLISLTEPLLDKQQANSFHGDGMMAEDIAIDLEIIAVTEDGIVEALSHKTLKILGIQWHPERQEKNFDNQIINRFFERNQTCQQN